MSINFAFHDWLSFSDCLYVVIFVLSCIYLYIYHEWHTMDKCTRICNRSRNIGFIIRHARCNFSFQKFLGNDHEKMLQLLTLLFDQNLYQFQFNWYIFIEIVQKVDFWMLHCHIFYQFWFKIFLLCPHNFCRVTLKEISIFITRSHFQHQGVFFHSRTHRQCSKWWIMVYICIFLFLLFTLK